MAAVIVLLLIAVIVLIFVVICLYRSYTKYLAAVLVLGLVLGLGWGLSTEMKYLALALIWGVVQKRHVGAPAPFFLSLSCSLSLPSLLLLFLSLPLDVGIPFAARAWGRTLAPQPVRAELDRQTLFGKFRAKFSPLVATIFRIFSENETSNLGDWVAKWHCVNVLDYSAFMLLYFMFYIIMFYVIMCLY